MRILMLMRTSSPHTSPRGRARTAGRVTRRVLVFCTSSGIFCSPIFKLAPCKTFKTYISRTRVLKPGCHMLVWGALLADESADHVFGYSTTGASPGHTPRVTAPFRRRYTGRVFKLFHAIFDLMPIATVVSKRVLARRPTPLPRSHFKTQLMSHKRRIAGLSQSRES